MGKGQRLQVVPVAAAFVLTVSAGAIFGAVKGTVTVLTWGAPASMNMSSAEEAKPLLMVAE